LISCQYNEKLYQYLGGTLKSLKCHPIQIGGMADHIHMLTEIPPDIAAAEVIRNVKVSATKWIKSSFSEVSEFAWQEGYGAFSVSASSREKVTNYIRNQEQHHKVKSFTDEFLELLDKHGITYDVKYLWV
jgi:REP element-mobilizing transposase RayT